MKLTATKRAEMKKSAVKEVRRQGNIPAILYSANNEAQSLVVPGIEFNTILREMQPGMLSTMVFELSIDGKKVRAIIKDIQYQLTNYQVSHLDFQELIDTAPVTVNVRVNCIGVMDCIGIKLGGFLRQVSRHIKVQCLPKHLPKEFVVDVKNLGIRQAIRRSDIEMPQGVKALTPATEVLVVIAKK